MTNRPPGGQRFRLAVTVVAGRRWRASARGLARWLARAAPVRARGQVAVALVGDAAMRRLNRQFRRVDRATDVLSFPSRPPDVPGARARPNGRRIQSPKSPEMNDLGDIAIAVGVARRQARTYRHSLSTELRILALHGLLHLLGYDHERDQGQMMRLEARLRRRMDLPAGLLTRATTPDSRP